MPDNFDKEMKKLRVRSVLLEERARLAVAQATISQSNLAHMKSIMELKELKKKTKL